MFAAAVSRPPVNTKCFINSGLDMPLKEHSGLLDHQSLVVLQVFSLNPIELHNKIYTIDFAWRLKAGFEIR